jgi:hypothetical protein
MLLKSSFIVQNQCCYFVKYIYMSIYLGSYEYQVPFMFHNIEFLLKNNDFIVSVFFDNNN